jgi:hypothetical protein
LQERADIMTTLQKKARRVFHVVLMILLIWAGVALLSVIINR